ncbi:MAG: hypothetical protein HQ534_06520 [Armatimonadetes bacterium]|nr:hypothetical protein [Armatimonadota bacterium]
MRNKKWLLILVLILFIINITFYVLVRLAKIDKLVEAKFANYLSQKLNSEIIIGNFTFNDKQINISDFELNDFEGKVKLNVKQIYIEYNLLKLIFTKIKRLQAIKFIKIYEPEVELNISSFPKRDKKFIIPDISNYFEKLDIYDGKVFVEFSNSSLDFRNEFDDISLSISNNKRTEISLTTKSEANSQLTAKINLKRGEILSVDLNLKDFAPQKLEISVVDTLYAKLDLDLKFLDNILEYSGSIKNIQITKNGKTVESKKNPFDGNLEQTEILFEELTVDENQVEGNLIISEIFSDSRKIKGEFVSNNVLISKYFKNIIGKASVKCAITGDFINPELNIKLNSEEIEFNNQILSNVILSGVSKDKKVNFKLEEAYWENNLIQGFGIYSFDDGLNFTAESKNFFWAGNGWSFAGKAKFSLDKKLKLDLKELEIQNENYFLKDLNLTASLDENDFSIEIKDKNNELSIESSGNLENKTHKTNIKLSRFDLSDFTGKATQPLVSGNMNISGNWDSLKAVSNIRVFDRDFGKFDGSFRTAFTLDFKKNISQFLLKTNNAKYNYEALDISIIAEGTSDSMHTKQFTINEDLNLTTWLTVKPEFHYGISLNSQKIKINSLLKYFTSSYFANNVEGYINLDINYDSNLDGNISGEINVEQLNLKYSDFNDIDASIRFFGNPTKIEILNCTLNSDNSKIIDLNGKISLFPDIFVQTNGKIENLELKNIFKSSDLAGNLNAVISFNHKDGKNKLDIDLFGKKIEFYDLQVDSLELSITQEDSLLTISKLSVERENEFNLQGNGAIGYIFWNDTNYPDSNFVKFDFNGDLFKLLSNHIKFIETGNSECDFTFELGMKENGLSIKEGSFNLSKASLQIKNQLEKIDKIQIEFDIADNQMNLKKCKMRMGEGKIYVRNIIENDDRKFLLGNLNLGEFFLSTSQNGILINIPKYVPYNSVVNAIITGRDSDELLITGPFDDIKIEGDIHFSNGAAIYPSNTENLLKLFTKVTDFNTKERWKNLSKPEQIEQLPIEKKSLPLNLDLMLYYEDNCHYVTYPVNLLVNPESYLHLIYYDGKFRIPEAFFSAEAGSADLFGTNFDVEFVQVRRSKYEKGIQISGSFYKKASDGSLITLEVFNVRDEQIGSLGALQYDLRSDNIEDKSVVSILSRLRYGKGIDEISDSQKRTLLQDPFIELAGLSISNAFIDPIISPIENKIRQLFRLDYFYLQTDIIQNIFARYYNDINPTDDLILAEKQEKISESGYDMFLNNLTVGMGKYISGNLFLDYIAHFQRPEGLAVSSEMGVYHNLSLRYDLPYKFKLALRYHILPFEEQNSYEIMLERSFRFW